MDETEILKFIEEIDPDGKISPDRIAEFIQGLKDLEAGKDLVVSQGTIFSRGSIEQLKSDYQKEEDWKKRTAVAAKIISLDLE